MTIPKATATIIGLMGLAVFLGLCWMIDRMAK